MSEIINFLCTVKLLLPPVAKKWERKNDSKKNSTLITHTNVNPHTNFAAATSECTTHDEKRAKKNALSHTKAKQFGIPLLMRCTHRICRSPFGVVSAGACDEESDRQTKQTGFRRSSPTFTTDWILESSSRNLGTNTTLFSDYLMQMETSAILFSHFLRADPEVCTMIERSP